MKQKKKVILLIGIIILVIAIVGGIIWYITTKPNQERDKESKVNQFYQTLANKKAYRVTTTLDNDNKMYYAKQDNKAYIDTIYNGKESKFIIKDGNSYLLVEDTKSYYTYNNNDTDLNKIEKQLEVLKDIEYETGKEKIENKTYSYEEYNILTDFVIGDIQESEEVKTRFYFLNNELVYIKTIAGDKQELLKVETSNQVDKNLFEIPSDYEKR